MDMEKSIERIVGYTVNFLNLDEDELLDIIEELVNEYENLEEKYKDLEQDLEENYRPIPVSEQYGISDRDFI